MTVLYSYVVAYDSGFAPNPFNGFCTLATCKPEIRKNASVGDWILGTGSDSRGVRRGGYLVHAMRVKEALTFAAYWEDQRFEKKRPNLNGSYRMACGDNIYYPRGDGTWHQLNSYHSNEDGSPVTRHIRRDTGVNRVLVSERFVYFGGEGPRIPYELRQAGLVHAGRGHRKIEDAGLIADFVGWLQELDVVGYQGRPYDMIKASRKRK